MASLTAVQKIGLLINEYAPALLENREFLEKARIVLDSEEKQLKDAYIFGRISIGETAEDYLSKTFKRFEKLK